MIYWLVSFFISFSFIVLTACSNGTNAASFSTSIVNSNFNNLDNGFPNGWDLDPKVKQKGKVLVLPNYKNSGNNALQLTPNNNNTSGDLYGLGQMFDAKEFRGKTFNISVSLAAEGNSTAIVGLHILGAKGDLGFVQLSQSNNNGKLESQKKRLKISSDANQIIVYVIVKGDSGSVLFENLSISALGSDKPKVGNAIVRSKEVKAIIISDLTKSIRKIPETLFGSNIEWINEGQGLWSKSAKKIDPRAVSLTKALNLSLLRFPGGVFSDYFHWKEGLVPQKNRLISLHYPSGPQSRQSFVINEAIDFSKRVNSNLLITVNAGTGDAKEASDWVRYMNKGESASNGVTYWEVGNELYMKGDISGGEMSASEYAKIFIEYSNAMKRVDPDIKMGAIGGLNYGSYRFIDDSNWTQKILEKASSKIDYLSIHNAYAPSMIGAPDSIDAVDVYRSLMGAPINIAKNLQDVSKLLEKYETKNHKIDIAVTEWGPFFHVLPSSPWVDHIKTMGSALFVGSTLNVLLREPKVKVATFFKLSDYGFMGWIGLKNGKLEKTAPYLAFSLYRQGLGDDLVETEVTSDTFNTNSIGVVDAVDNVPYLDVVTSRSKETVSVIVVNRDFKNSIQTSLQLKGLISYKKIEIQTLTGSALDANTGTQLPDIPGLKWAKQINISRFNNGGEKEITLSHKSLPGKHSTNNNSELSYSFKPMSITLLKFIGAHQLAIKKQEL